MSDPDGQMHEVGAPDGVYVYCTIETSDPKTFGGILIGGRGDEVFTIHHRDLAAVVSRAPLLVYDPTRENALTHEHVQEIVMNEHGFTPVPMSFWHALQDRQRHRRVPERHVRRASRRPPEDEGQAGIRPHGALGR